MKFRLIVVLLTLLILPLSPVSAQRSTGKDALFPFPKIPVTAWVGEKLVFLHDHFEGKDDFSWRELGYKSRPYDTWVKIDDPPTLDEELGLHHPTDDEVCGKTATVTAVSPIDDGAPGWTVYAVIDETKQKIKTTTGFGSVIFDVVFSRDLNESLKRWKGKQLWVVKNTTFFASDEKTWQEVPKFGSVIVDGIEEGILTSRPIRFKIHTQSGFNGYYDIAVSATNLNTDARFRDECFYERFSETAPPVISKPPPSYAKPKAGGSLRSAKNVPKTRKTLGDRLDDKANAERFKVGPLIPDFVRITEDEDNVIAVFRIDSKAKARFSQCQVGCELLDSTRSGGEVTRLRGQWAGRQIAQSSFTTEIAIPKLLDPFPTVLAISYIKGYRDGAWKVYKAPGFPDGARALILLPIPLDTELTKQRQHLRDAVGLMPSNVSSVRDLTISDVRLIPISDANPFAILTGVVHNDTGKTFRYVEITANAFECRKEYSQDVIYYKTKQFYEQIRSAQKKIISSNALRGGGSSFDLEVDEVDTFLLSIGENQVDSGLANTSDLASGTTWTFQIPFLRSGNHANIRAKITRLEGR